MLTDDRFGHDLGVALHREVQDVRAAPDLVSTLRQRRARRTWAIRTAIAAPVAAAAVAVVVVTTAGHDAAPAPTQAAGPATSTQVRVENVAYVRDETLKALGRATQYVIFARSTHHGGYYDTWTDKATQRYRNDVYTSNAPENHVPNGKLTAPPAQGSYPIHLTQSHAVSGPDGDQTIVTVDYEQKAWFTSHDTNRYPSTEPIITDADSVRRAITDGTLELLGHETVDGIDTLHLRLYGPKREYRIDMWVDARTYLPVQEIAAKSTGPNQFPDSAAVTEHYTWLPRTPENLAKLTLTPPPGFRRLK